MAAPADLTAVFDHFVADMNVLTDPLMLETAGAQCLLLAGFFEDQMRRRHNIHWYAELGAGFFRRAAAAEQSAVESETARHHRKTFRAVAPPSCTAQPRAARLAVSDFVAAPRPQLSALYASSAFLTDLFRAVL